ncbi:hypothetical protein ACFV9C_25450 [Kribbella sp. NPDC059898]|uniref:hypothetical protein n=1 Tax=Kribbella sp. NPDC059898 TaxID=3346995 RepID=UPI003646ABD0
MNTTTKVTKLTDHQSAALTKGVTDNKLVAEVTKTTVTFPGDASRAASAVRTYQEVLAAQFGRKGGDYQALHAVARKLEEGKEIEVSEGPADEPPAPKLKLVADSTNPESLVKIPGLNLEVPANPKDVFGKSVGQAVTEERARRTAMQAAEAALKAAGYEKVADRPAWGTAEVHGLKDGDVFLFYGTNPAELKKEPTVRKYNAKRIGGADVEFWASKSETKPEKAAPAKKDAPAKKAAGVRAIPTEAANKTRQDWIVSNGGLDAYKKQYNSGWDNATYGTGQKKAESGEAGAAYMDGYTDRQANPGKDGIKNKWAALRSTTAPVKAVAPAKK